MVYYASLGTRPTTLCDIILRDISMTSQSVVGLVPRVFNPHAPANSTSTISACYRKHESAKRRAYKQRIIEVEHGTFTPLVFSSIGGWGPSAIIAYKRLANLISEKQGQSYNSAINWIRCRISHSLVNSAVACIRAPKSAHHTPEREINLTDHPLDLLQSEVQLLD